jgi:hypothetical protein
MIFNQLNVKPTDDTLEYLSNVMSGSPLDLDIASYSVEVITTQDELVAKPDNVYQARCLNLRVWYDAYLQRSSLILSLASPDLVERCMELHKEDVVRAFYNHYYPYLTIRANMPALSRNFRTFVHTTANILCGNERMLEFTGEYIEQVNLHSPPNYEYQMAQLNEQATRTE